MKSIIQMVSISVALCLATSCVGTIDEREVDLDAGWTGDYASEDSSPADDDGANNQSDTHDASGLHEDDGSPVESDPEDDNAPQEDDGGHPDDEVDSDEVATCVESCGDCTFGVNDCCEHDVCQDDWSGVSRCMPVVPPNGTCPSNAPTPGDSCAEPGLICRYDHQNRCKCGCDGWNCPFLED